MLRQQQETLSVLFLTYTHDPAYPSAAGASAAAAAEIPAAKRQQHGLMAAAAADAAAPATAEPAAAAAAAAAAGQSGPLSLGQVFAQSVPGSLLAQALGKLAQLRCPNASKSVRDGTPVSALLPDLALLLLHVNQQVLASRISLRTAANQLGALREFLQEQQHELAADGFNYQQMLDQLAEACAHHAARFRPHHGDRQLKALPKHMQLREPPSPSPAQTADSNADSARSDPQWPEVQAAGAQHKPPDHAAAAAAAPACADHAPAAGLQLPQQEGLRMRSLAEQAAAVSAAAGARADQAALARVVGRVPHASFMPSAVKAAAAAVGSKRPGSPASKGPRKRGPAPLGIRQCVQLKGRAAAGAAAQITDNMQEDPAFLAAQPLPSPSAAADSQWQAPAEAGAEAAAVADGAGPWGEGSSQHWQEAAGEWDAWAASADGDPMRVDDQEGGQDGAACAAGQAPVAAAAAACGGSMGLLQTQHTSTIKLAAPTAPAAASVPAVLAGAAGASAAVTISGGSKLPAHPQSPAAALAVDQPSCAPAAGTPASQRTPTAPQPQATAPASPAPPVGVVRIKREPGADSPPASPSHQRQQQDQQSVHNPVHPAVLIKQEPVEYPYRVLVMVTTGVDDSLQDYWEQQAAAAAAAAQSSISRPSNAAPGAQPVTAPCGLPTSAVADAGSSLMTLQQQHPSSADAAAGRSSLSLQQLPQHTTAAGAGSSALGLLYQPQHTTPTAATGTGSSSLGLQQLPQHTAPAAATGTGSSLQRLQQQPFNTTPAAAAAATGVGSSVVGQQQQAQHNTSTAATVAGQPASSAAAAAVIGGSSQPAAALQQKPGHDKASPNSLVPSASVDLDEEVAMIAMLEQRWAALQEQAKGGLGGGPAEPQPARGAGLVAAAPVARQQGPDLHPSGGSLQQVLPYQHPPGPHAQRSPCEQQQQQLHGNGKGPGFATAAAGREATTGANIAGRPLQYSPCSYAGPANQQQQQQLSPRRAPGQVTALPVNISASPVRHPPAAAAAAATAAANKPLPSADPASAGRITLGQLKAQLEVRQLQQQQQQQQQQQGPSIAFAGLQLLESMAIRELGGAAAGVSAVPAAPLLLQWDKAHTLNSAQTAFERATPAARSTMLVHLKGLQQLLEPEFLPCLQRELSQQQQAFQERCRGANLPASPIKWAQQTGAPRTGGLPGRSGRSAVAAGAGGLGLQVPGVAPGAQHGAAVSSFGSAAVGWHGKAVGKLPRGALLLPTGTPQGAAAARSGGTAGALAMLAAAAGHLSGDTAAAARTPSCTTMQGLQYEPRQLQAQLPHAATGQQQQQQQQWQDSRSHDYSAAARHSADDVNAHTAAEKSSCSKGGEAAERKDHRGGRACAISGGLAAADSTGPVMLAAVAAVVPAQSHPAASTAPSSTATLAAAASHSAPRQPAQPAASASGSAGLAASTAGAGGGALGGADMAASSAPRPIVAAGAVRRSSWGGADRAASSGGAVGTGSGGTECVDLWEAQRVLLEMFISEPSLLDREQAMALKGALEMWQKEGGEPLQLARFQVDYKWVLLCRDLAGFTTEDRRAAMLYMLGNMTLSTTDPSVAQLIGWTSSWLKAEAGFVEAVRGLQDTPQLGEQLQDVLEALSWLGAGSIVDQQAKQFLSDMQWVCLQWAFCKGSAPMMPRELQEAFGKLVTLARAVLQAA